VALSRALTEAAQARLSYIVGIRDDIGATAYANNDAHRAGGLLLDALAARRPPRRFDNNAGFLSDDIAADVRWQLERLRAAGLSRVIVVDLTRPEYGWPVVRIVIPGLEAVSSDPDYRQGARARAASSADP
jgi:ribosomal protein S12 methylthiotransferase accessory factor